MIQAAGRAYRLAENDSMARQVICHLAESYGLTERAADAMIGEIRRQSRLYG